MEIETIEIQVFKFFLILFRMYSRITGTEGVQEILHGKIRRYVRWGRISPGTDRVRTSHVRELIGCIYWMVVLRVLDFCWGHGGKLSKGSQC